jgi:hypothetical protein
MVLGFICSFLFVSLAGFCMADETPAYVLYIQGGGSTVAEIDDDGMQVLTIHDIIPYFHFLNGERSNLVPIQSLCGLAFPAEAALLFKGAGGESVSMVRVSNLSLTDGDKSLTLQVTPTEYYEGKPLESFVRDNKELPRDGEKNITLTGLYIESTKTPANAGTVCTNVDSSTCFDLNYCRSLSWGPLSPDNCCSSAAVWTGSQCCCDCHYQYC